MHLYLIRHAEAEELGVAGITRDFDRPLTARGRTQSRALAQAFAQRGIVIDAVAASPLVRAHQTAVEFLSVLDPNSRTVTCDELAYDRLKPGKLSEFLAALPSRSSRTPSREEKSIAAVGHMPDLAAYLEWLLGAAPRTIHLAKAAVAYVHFRGEIGRAEGELRWLVTPEWFMPRTT